jgi:hypothetical protein
LCIEALVFRGLKEATMAWHLAQNSARNPSDLGREADEVRHGMKRLVDAVRIGVPWSRSATRGDTSRIGQSKRAAGHAVGLSFGACVPQQKPTAHSV